MNALNGNGVLVTRIVGFVTAQTAFYHCTFCVSLTLTQFGSWLKTHLFCLAYTDAPRDCLGCKGCA